MEKVTCTNCHKENSINDKFCSNCGFALAKIETETKDPKFNEPTALKKSNKIKLIGLIVGAITFGLSYFAVQHIFFKTPSFDKVMIYAASEVNKMCPIMVDEYTRLDNAVALPGNIFQYNYTLVDIAKDEVNLDTVRKYIEPRIINNVKTNPDLKIYRDNKTTMTYYYKDKNGVFVHKLSVTPDLYAE